ncbi:hypothetical protein BH10PAT1_BH10PAT1_5860 [soil metagenome]
MKKIVFVIFICFVIILVALLAYLRFVKKDTLIQGINLSDSPVATVINQNTSVTVDINSTKKLNSSLKEILNNNKKLTIIISGEKFAVGQNDYWQNTDNTQIFFGGYSTDLNPTNPSINLAVDIPTVKEHGWDENAISKYLEYKLYSAIFNAQSTTGSDPDVDKLVKNYFDKINKAYPVNLFKVSYVK